MKSSLEDWQNVGASPDLWHVAHQLRMMFFVEAARHENDGVMSQ